MEADQLLQQLRDLPTANSAVMLPIHRQMSLAAPLTLAGVLLNLLLTRDPTVPVRATQLSLLTKLPSLQSKNNSPNRRRMQLSLKRTMKIPKVQTLRIIPSVEDEENPRILLILLEKLHI